MVPFPIIMNNNQPSNPIFKVTPLFDAKYLTNGYRFGHSYHRRRIGIRTQTFEWHQFQWLEWPLSQISKSRYYSTSKNSQMVQDIVCIRYTRCTRYKRLIESHTWLVELRHFQWPWMTPNPDFKVRPFSNAEYLQMAKDTAIVTMEGE